MDVQSSVIEKALKVVAAPAGGHPATSQKASSIIAVSENVAKQDNGIKKVTYPTITPDRARTSFEWPTNFGQWCIYISSTAFKHLRQFCRADKERFKIIQGKIVQLSQGSPFSDVSDFFVLMIGDSFILYILDRILFGVQSEASGRRAG